MNDVILDEMDLPLANPNEELETISKSRLLPLFDVKQFEIRSEDLRDKGIDFHFEIKKVNRHTNFRFAVQLKATESKQLNADKSISLQIHTSNINYLLNNSMPAYYVLYFKNTDTFYYESLNDFVKELSEKNTDWQNQKTHILRFQKTLSLQAIKDIYETTIKNGMFHRQVNERLIIQSSSALANDKILFDKDLNISGDDEIRNFIENAGQFFINEGKWQDVLQLHKKGSGSIAVTARYNLVLGIANYYNGNLLTSLSFFKTALKLKKELSAELKDSLAFFYISCKSSLGLITGKVYQNEMALLENADSVGLYVQFDKAVAEYYNSLTEKPDEKFDNLIKKIDKITSNSKADINLSIYAKSELILIHGSKINMDNTKEIAVINAYEELTGPNPQMRAAALGKFISASSEWFKNVQDIKQVTLERNNFFQYFTILINEVKVVYEMQSFSRGISIEQNISGRPSPEPPDNRPLFNDLLSKIDNALQYFRAVGHIENQVVALCLKYELKHYLEEFPDADAAIIEAEDLIESYELTDKKRRLNHLKNNGTTHEVFKAWVSNAFKGTDNARKEVQDMVEHMKEIDESEKNMAIGKGKHLVIHLFPIGYFQFPEISKNIVYEILNIKKSDAKANFNAMLNMVIPVANIYYPEISEEGFRDGKLADKGIENWRNIYRVRKAFHENKFYRKELNF